MKQEKLLVEEYLKDILLHGIKGYPEIGMDQIRNMFQRCAALEAEEVKKEKEKAHAYLDETLDGVKMDFCNLVQDGLNDIEDEYNEIEKLKIDNVKKEIADQKRQCVEKLRKEIGEKEKEVIEDVKKQADEKEKEGIENARLSAIEMRKTEIRKMKKEVDDKKTRKKILTAIEVKKEGDQAPVTTKRMAYDFDEEGFPIWEERPIPPESIGPTPPGWDTNPLGYSFN